MKKSLQFIGVVNISLMLGFVMSLCSGYAFHNEQIVYNQAAFELAGWHSIESTNFLSHAAEAESLVRSTAHAPSSSLKNPLSGFSLVTKSVESNTQRASSSDDYYLQKLITRVQHTDLIFPFHYFW